MTIRNLQSLFAPRSVAVVGATGRPASVGGTLWRNLREGGFAGPRWAVNLKHTEIDGEPVYRSLAALPGVPDLAVICTPAATVPALIDQLGTMGTRAAVVLSAGFDAATRQAMLDAARAHLLRILGPNCLGLIAPHAGLNASFAHAGVRPGSLALVSQSGALVTAMLDWAASREIGFSHCISLGEHADVDFGDLLDWLGSDGRTRAILLYVEAIESARKFMSAARAAARNKPVLVVKAGRSPQGQAAASSHTGALAGSDAVYDAAIRRAGMLRVDTLQDLFGAAETLAHFQGSHGPAPGDAGERLTLVTNGGGAGVLAADAAEAAGVPLAPLSDATRGALDAAMPAHWSRRNPVDIIGDAPVERYASALRTLLADRDSGTLLFMHAPTAIVPAAEIAREIEPLLRGAPGRVLSCWLGDAAVRSARQRFAAAGLPCYDTPEAAVAAFAMLRNYRRNQAELMQAPPAQRSPGGIDGERVRALIDGALAAGRTMLDESEAKAVLAASGVPVVATRVVAPEAQAAVAAAAAIGFPVALKLLSPQVTHKSDVGGVVLDLETAADVRAAAEAMLARLAQRRPDVVVTGFTVQPMVRRPRAIELIVGSSIDATFGPVLLFGRGGTAVEVLADRALALPPLNAPLARSLIERTAVARLLHGWRDVPPADLDAVAEVLIAISELLAAEPRIAELDINPLLADAQGVIALDARIRIDASAPGGAQRFAILPYPAELTEQLDWRNRRVTLRPIRPEDHAQHLTFLSRLEPNDIRLRVFYWRRSIEASELARLTQIDYGREMAFVATALDGEGHEETLGVVRAICDPDNRDAEFGIVVRSDLKGGGLGRRLMGKLIGYLRDHGTQRVVAEVLLENAAMLALLRELGFASDADQPDPGVRRVFLKLN